MLKKKIKINSFMTFMQILQSAIIVSSYAAEQHCRNLNGQTGVCVSIRECKSFNDLLHDGILNTNFTLLTEFVRLSHCNKIDKDNASNYPTICCTIEEKQKRSQEHVVGRIVYPGASGYQHDHQHQQYNTQHEETTAATIATHELLNAHQNDRIIFPERTTNLNLHSYIANDQAVEDVSSTSEKPILNDVTAAEKLPQAPQCGAITVAKKIFGGVETDLNEFPWMANLEYRTASGNLISVCAGSLINSRYILTAAHCIKGAIEKKVGKIESVRLGEHNTVTPIDCKDTNCLEPFQRFSIESITVHDNYDKTKQPLFIRQHNDIALIRLSRPVQMTISIQPVCLPNVDLVERLPKGMKLTVAGWGHTGNTKSSDEKLKVNVPVVDLQECRRLYSKMTFIADEQLCAGGVFREDSCSGDSGGPLMRLSQHGWILEGIVSYGRGCGLEIPGIYTRVSSYLDWIQRNMQL